MTNDQRAELDALLADKAADEVNPEELARLDELRAALPDVDVEKFDRLVGEVTAALVQPSTEAMPRALYERIAATGEQMRAGGAGGEDEEPDILSISRRSTQTKRGGVRWTAWSGWAVAAAVTAMWLGGVGQRQPSERLTLSEQRAQLIEASADAVEVGWSATEDPAAAGTSGDVVWSNATQSGMMRFVGLEANDPAQLRYQLWIFDGTRDERYPIDGGLFDVQPGATEVLVPVDARLRVGQPTLFAVTVERSDGVVVSDRGRIVVVAPMADLSQAGQ